jgi:hypothetical protein
MTASTSGQEFRKIDIVRNSSAALNESTSINLESLGFTYNTQLIFTIPGLIRTQLIFTNKSFRTRSPTSL